MSDTVIQFIVEFVPPSNVAALRHGLNGGSATKPRKLRMAFQPTDTFKEVWTNVQQQWDRSYAADERQFVSFQRLQDPAGADITLDWTVGFLFRKDDPINERTIYVPLTRVDYESSIAPGSALQPEGYRTRAIEDLTPEKQAQFKRYKQEEERYGTSISTLDANTPVRSREDTNADAQHDSQEQEAQLRVDNEGFKIPGIPRKCMRPSNLRNTQHADESQETVLVEDSQPHVSASRAPTSHKQSKTSRSLQFHPALHSASSPAEAAATSPLNAAAPQPQTSASLRSPLDPNTRQSLIPTPDSHEKKRLSNEAPTSAQRPRSAHTSASARSRSFLTRTPSRPESIRDMAVEDPIEDSLIMDNLVSVGGDGDGPQEQRRGRTRSRSIESPVRQLQLEMETSDPPALPSSSQLQDDDYEEAEVEPTPATELPSSNAFDQLASSQRTGTSEERTGKWTIEEDKQLLRGIRKGLNAAQIIKSSSLLRSESGLRNRHRILLRKFPNGTVPKTSALSDGDEPATISKPSAKPQSRPEAWSENHITMLRQAIGEGLYPQEIQLKHFPGRSAESVTKKYRAVKESVYQTWEEHRPEFPKDTIEAPGWTTAHSLKLRRAYHDPTVTDEDAHQRWLKDFPLAVVKAKLKAYGDQLEVAAATKAFEESENAEEDDIQQTLLSDSSQAFNVFERQTQASNKDSSQLTADQKMSSSSPMVIDVQSVPRTAADVAEGKRHNANKAQASLSSEATREKASNGGIKQPVSRIGNLRQTNLSFLSKTGKKSEGSSSPFTAELDAHPSRTSTDAITRLQQEDAFSAQPKTLKDQRAAASSSNGASKVNVEHYEQSDEDEEDGETDYEKLEKEIDREEQQKQIDSQLTDDSQGNNGRRMDIDSDSPAVKDFVLIEGSLLTHDSLLNHNSTPANASITINDSLPPGEPQAKTQLHHSQILSNNLESQSFTELDESAQRTISKNHASLRAAVEQSTAQTPQQPKRSPLGLPQTGGPANNFRQRQENVTQPAPVKVEGSAERLAKRRPQTPRENNASAKLQEAFETPRRQGQAIAKRLPGGQKSVDTSTQSQSQTQSQSLTKPDTVGIVDNWVPFENRPRNADGQIDAGRAGFPCLIQHGHSWVKSESEMLREAKRLAKPAFVQDMYNYIKVDSLQLIRATAQDTEDLQRLLKIRLSDRNKARKKMGLPPLKAMDDNDDDQLDMQGMLKEKYQAKNDSDSDMEDDQYPDGVVYDRPVEELDEDDIACLDALLEIRQPATKMAYDLENEEEDDLPTIPRALPLDSIPGPTDAELQDPLPSGDEMDVYDEARGFDHTAHVPGRSSSPAVQPTGQEVPSTFDNLQSAQVQVQAQAQTQTLDGTSEIHNQKGVEEASQCVPSEHDTVETSQDSMPAYRPRQTKATAGKRSSALAKGHSARVAGVNGVKAQSQEVKQKRTSDSKRPDTVRSPKRKRDRLQSASDSEDGKVRTPKNRKKAKTEKGVNATPYVAVGSGKLSDANRDREMMPPPPIIPQTTPRLQQLVRQDTTDSLITSNTSDSRNGPKSDGIDWNRRSLRRKKARQKRMSAQDLGSGMLDGSGVAVATSPAQQGQGSGVANSIEAPSNPTINTNDETEGAGVWARMKAMVANAYHPPAPKPREPSPPLRLPYGSDEEDSTSDDSD